MATIADNLQAPYYAVIFTNRLRQVPQEGYEKMAERMCELAAQQPGYLGFESSRDPSGFAISVSYWKDMESIKSWKQVSEHLSAQQQGKSDWYSDYRVRICRVEQEYSWSQPSN